MSRELAPVELVDRSGRQVGVTTVAQAHAAPGQRHRAFSVLLVTLDGERLLLQRRAASKLRFPSRWGNACCGHPGPGEPVVSAATRRLREEIGLVGTALTEVGVHHYRADDPASGLVEHEYDHVLVGRVPAEYPWRPDPAEVAELRWVGPSGLHDLLGSPECVPWLAGVAGPLATAVGPHWGR